MCLGGKLGHLSVSTCRLIQHMPDSVGSQKFLDVNVRPMFQQFSSTYDLYPDSYAPRCSRYLEQGTSMNSLLLLQRLRHRPTTRITWLIRSFTEQVGDMATRIGKAGYRRSGMILVSQEAICTDSAQGKHITSLYTNSRATVPCRSLKHITTLPQVHPPPMTLPTHTEPMSLS
jgi:hypothetical protein